MLRQTDARLILALLFRLYDGFCRRQTEVQSFGFLFLFLNHDCTMAFAVDGQGSFLTIRILPFSEPWPGRVGSSVTCNVCVVHERKTHVCRNARTSAICHAYTVRLLLRHWGFVPQVVVHVCCDARIRTICHAYAVGLLLRHWGLVPQVVVARTFRHDIT